MEFSYEKAVNRIKEITKLLESDDIEMEKSFELFAEAKKLMEECEKYLDKKQAEFNILVEDNFDDIEAGNHDEDIPF